MCQAIQLEGKRVAVQEYGVSNPDLIAGLEARGALVFPVPVYRWALPKNQARCATLPAQFQNAKRTLCYSPVQRK